MFEGEELKILWENKQENMSTTTPTLQTSLLAKLVTWENSTHQHEPYKHSYKKGVKFNLINLSSGGTEDHSSRK